MELQRLISNRIFKYVLFIGILLLLGLYLTVNPSNSSFFPKCPFRLLTGFQCPGCGSQRALHHLLNLDFIASFKQNPLLIISTPYIIFGFVYEGLKTPSMPLKRFRKRLYGRDASIIILVIVILFAVLRNIPYFQ